MIAMDLPNAPMWQFKGHLIANRIFRKGRYINLETVTDQQVESLMAKEPKYWGNHFQEKEKPAPTPKKEKEKDSSK